MQLVITSDSYVIIGADNAMSLLYCVCVCTTCFIKTTPYLIAHNFGKWWPIFTNFSLSDSAEILMVCLRC